MSEQQNKIPLPGEPEKEPDLLKYRKWFGTDTTGCLLDFAKPYTPPKWTLNHNGINFAKRGDLHIVGGKSGHGKTAFMSQIMAAILCGRFGNMTCQIEGEPTVLYIDTEQSEDDTIAIKNRVCTLAGIPYNVPQPRFKVARLRDTVQVEERYKMILQLMWEMKPDVVFIDGLLDIVNDYNSQTECSDIIRDLMAYSTALNMSMWCVLHENPMTDKLVGSLGSIAERKVTEVFVIRKHKGPHTEKRFKDFPSVFFEIKQTKARGKDQEDWYFTVEDRALGWGVPVELGSENMVKHHEPREIQGWITELQNNVTWPTTRSDIYKNILTPKGITDADEQREVVDTALRARLLLEEPKEPGQRNARLNINRIIIPF